MADLLHGREALTLPYSLDAQEIEAPAATAPGLPHLAAHHIWVVSGTVTFASRWLSAGFYMLVPPGVRHAATAGDDGCTLLQMHRPHLPTEADLLAGLA